MKGLMCMKGLYVIYFGLGRFVVFLRPIFVNKGFDVYLNLKL